MVLFEDNRKAPTINIKKILGDRIFNHIHLVGECNGYNIINLYGFSPNMIVYPNSRQIYYFLKSLSFVSSKSLLKKNLETYMNMLTDNSLKYYQSYVNRNVKYEMNYYKPFVALVYRGDDLLRYNRLGRIMFNIQEDNIKNKTVLTNHVCNLYDYLYDSNVVLKQPDSIVSYMLELLNKDVRGDLIIITPPSYIRRQLTIDDYEFLLSSIDLLEKRGATIILIDDIVYGKKYNLLFEIQSKMHNRYSARIKHNHSETLVLTNLKFNDIIN